MKEKNTSIKHEYKECLVLIKNGSFYITFCDDALILNYLFNYKVINNKVGFPISNLDKVLSKLDSNNISYYIDDNYNNNPINNYNNILYNAKTNYFNNTNLDLLIDEIKFVISLDPNNLKLIKEYLQTLKK